MARTPWSTRLLRALLRLYPREFRERFAADLEADFDEILAARGRRAAWSYALADLRRALPMVHSDDQRARQRRYAVTLGGEDHMESLSVDLRHALRALVKSPVFTGVTVLTLGARHRREQRRLQPGERRAAEPARLPGSGAADGDPRGHPRVDDPALRRVARGLSSTSHASGQLHATSASTGSARSSCPARGGSESIVVADVTAAVFPLLGASAVEGRTFLPEEDGVGPSGVVIGDGLRRRRFAGASPIGERLMLDRRPYTIVGVMPAGFVFPPRGPQFNSQPADA